MAFATTDDIADRLELSALTAEQDAAATQLLETATAIICVTAGRDEADISPVPDLVKGLTIELVCRAMASPQGLSSASETLGEYTRSETYRRDLSSVLLLTQAEQLILRKAIHGRTSDSVMIGTHFQEVE